MPKKKAPPEFWIQYEEGRKWFANLGPIRLCVVDPQGVDDKTKVAYASFIAHIQLPLEGDWTLDQAKQSAVDLADELLTNSLNELKKLPNL